jgi:arginine repressor
MKNFMYSKIQRQNKIKELLKIRTSPTGEELVEFMKKELATHGTLSRDFRGIGVVRTSAAEGSRYFKR